MIPHTIHYCWFGKKALPESAQQCIASWQKYLPDYEIVEWNEDNFDVNMVPYTREAYEMKKYAFVSDYARFWILYNYGGIYFDVDVEVIKPLQPLIDKGAYMGWEIGVKLVGVNPGLGFASEAHSLILRTLLDLYDKLSFKEEYAKPVRKTITEYTMDVLIEKGMQVKNVVQKVEDFTIYPSDYFGPVDVVTKRLHKTSNTYSIHAYAASWNERTNSKRKRIIRNLLPEWLLVIIYKFKHEKIFAR